MSALAEWMATANSHDRQHTAAHRAVRLDCFHRILRTRWSEAAAAAGAKQESLGRRNDEAIQLNEKTKNLPWRKDRHSLANRAVSRMAKDHFSKVLPAVTSSKNPSPRPRIFSRQSNCGPPGSIPPAVQSRAGAGGNSRGGAAGHGCVAPRRRSCGWLPRPVWNGRPRVICSNLPPNSPAQGVPPAGECGRSPGFASRATTGKTATASAFGRSRDLIRPA